MLCKILPHETNQRSLLCCRGGPGSARRSLGRNRREDQEARQNSLFPEEVAAHHVGHLHRHQGAGGQQQRLLPRSRSRSEPAQVQFGHLPAWGELGQRAQRHARVNSDPLTRLEKKKKKKTKKDVTREHLVCVCRALCSESARGSYGVSCEQRVESDHVQ